MLEKTLLATLKAHPDCGVALWRPRKLRAMKGFKAAAKHFDDQGDPKDAFDRFVLEELKDKLADEFDLERQRGVKTLIVSEENILGTMKRNFTERAFYQGAARRLKIYADLLPKTPRKIAMGVREYSSVWTSAYFYSKERANDLPAPDEMRLAMIADDRGWLNVTRDIQSVWPDAPIQMWRQEDLADHITSICASITDLDTNMIVVPDGKINARAPTYSTQILFEKNDLVPLSARYKRHLRRINRGQGIEWIGGPLS